MPIAFAERSAGSSPAGLGTLRSFRMPPPRWDCCSAGTGLATLATRCSALEPLSSRTIFTRPACWDVLALETTACPWDRFYESVERRGPRLVILSSVNYNTGFAPPLAELADFLHARSVLLLYVDGTQSVGALRFDTARVQPDMLAVHGYKWLLSPNGAGFFYIAPQLRERIQPNVVGWRSHRDWRNVDNLHHGVPELLLTAEKYEGGSLSFALLYAMEASIDLIMEIGLDVVEQRVPRPGCEGARDLASTGRDVVADCASPVVAARFAKRDVSALARALKEQRVLVAARRGHLRVSPHLYNNEQDLEIFERALRGAATTRNGSGVSLAGGRLHYARDSIAR